jgi:hypothetical protein
LAKAIAKAEKKKQREEEKFAAKLAKKAESERVKKLKKQPSPCGKKKHTMADIDYRMENGASVSRAVYEADLDVHGGGAGGDQITLNCLKCETELKEQQQCTVSPQP